MTGLERALRDAIARWNEGDLDGYLALYDEGVKLYGYSPEPMNQAAVRHFYTAIWASLPALGRPNPLIEIHDVIAGGDRVACRFTMTGRHSGAFMGVPATNRDYALTGITILRFEGARAVERWSSADMLGLLVQRGAVPPPG
jgi:predicted ester cyclase